MKVGDLVTKTTAMREKLYGIITAISVTGGAVKVLWNAGYGSFWASISQVEVISASW